MYDDNGRHGGLRREDSFVFWPLNSDPLFPLVGTFSVALLPDGNGFPSSDHRLVAADLEVPRGSGGHGRDGRAH